MPSRSVLTVDHFSMSCLYILTGFTGTHCTLTVVCKCPISRSAKSHPVRSEWFFDNRKLALSRSDSIFYDVFVNIPICVTDLGDKKLGDLHLE